MDELLRKMCAEGLDASEEARLVEEHHRHFARRLRRFGELFLPGAERSPEAVRSLGNGAYASFAEEPNYQGLPAFRYSVVERLKAHGFLYYWRASATVRFLLREASAPLSRHLANRRNVRRTLDACFVVVGGVGGRPLWWTSTVDVPARRAEAGQVELPKTCRARGEGLVRLVLERAGAPMTCDEIVEVVDRRHGLFAIDWEAEPTAEPSIEPDLGAPVVGEQMERCARAFFETLDADERSLLVARGYAEEGVPRRSFREVAVRLGKRSDEWWRLRERSILMRFAERFADRDEAEAAVAFLVRWLKES